MKNKNLCAQKAETHLFLERGAQRNRAKVQLSHTNLQANLLTFSQSQKCLGNQLASLSSGLGVLQESLLAATLTAANIERVSRACGVAASWPTFFAAALERFSSALPSCMGKVAASSCKMF